MKYLNETWNSLSLFLSTTTTQKYLKKRYTQIGYPDCDSLSYQNCQSFIYYLEYAQTYYEQAQTASLSLRPILQFYGFIQLLKACILTVNPSYPNSSSLLAHGVSTRKRKKQQYSFLTDEVKVQKNGLFSHMSEKMFHVKHLEGTKITMADLFSQIPEMDQELSYFHLTKSTPLIQVNDHEYTMSDQILNVLHMTPTRFEAFFHSAFKLPVIVSEQNKIVILKFEKELTDYNLVPFRFNILNQLTYLIPLKGYNHEQYNEIMAHYLLLYNLSMIARYETEWWIDLIKTTPNEDYPLIHKFLSITQQKAPFLVANWLFNKNLL